MRPVILHVEKKIALLEFIIVPTLECLIAGLTAYLFLKIFPARKLLLGTLRLLNFQIFGKNLGF